MYSKDKEIGGNKMTVNELRSILNTICVNKECEKYSVCISMEGVFTDMVAFDLDDKGKRIMLEEK